MIWREGSCNRIVEIFSLIHRINSVETEPLNANESMHFRAAPARFVPGCTTTAGCRGCRGRGRPVNFPTAGNRPDIFYYGLRLTERFLVLAAVN